MQESGLMTVNIMSGAGTGRAVTMAILDFGPIRRFILSTLRGSGKEWNTYSMVGFIPVTELTDTDTLEEVTAHVTGFVFDIVNVRQQTGSHTEVDLEMIHGQT